MFAICDARLNKKRKKKTKVDYTDTEGKEVDKLLDQDKKKTTGIKRKQDVVVGRVGDVNVIEVVDGADAVDVDGDVEVANSVEDAAAGGRGDGAAGGRGGPGGGAAGGRGGPGGGGGVDSTSGLASATLSADYAKRAADASSDNVAASATSSSKTPAPATTVSGSDASKSAIVSTVASVSSFNVVQESSHVSQELFLLLLVIQQQIMRHLLRNWILSLVVAPSSNNYCPRQRIYWRDFRTECFSMFADWVGCCTLKLTARKTQHSVLCMAHWSTQDRLMVRSFSNCTPIAS